MATLHDVYQRRPHCYHKISHVEWSDWQWQQRNTLKHSGQLQEVFPHIGERQIELAREWERQGFRFQLTPYMLAITERDAEGNPLLSDPVWRQFFPVFDELLVEQGRQALDEYSTGEENWEIAQEMLTPIAHHKYDNRVILYTTDTCLGYCDYCLRSLQSTAQTEMHGGKQYWQETIQILRNHPEIEEIILSGGDPLIFSNSTIAKMIEDVRAIPTIKAIRLHTRAFTHNPYRVDDEFGKILCDYSVTEVAIHIAHPNELTQELQKSIGQIRKSGARTLLMAQIPLIKGVNNNPKILRSLFMGLYMSGIKPYYLLHNMPNIPAASSQRTSVRQGIDIMNTLGRKISHPAMPEYIIVHKTGKKTVPNEPNGTSEFIYCTSPEGHPIIRFKNWNGNWETYIDGID
ncbi:TPA: hypothetical protein DCR79_00950 [Patescibacteria group bacterium]|nr:hypothetical protein [Patescibacteria group bacterium]